MWFIASEEGDSKETKEKPKQDVSEDKTEGTKAEEATGGSDAFEESLICIITARVRSTTGRYCFHRCLSVHRGGGPVDPSLNTPPGGGVRVPPRGGYRSPGIPPGGGGYRSPGTPPGG